MNDTELGQLIRETMIRTRGMDWTPTDDTHAAMTGVMERVERHWTQVALQVRKALLNDAERERTAATILAALIQAETAAAAANGGKREIVVKALISDAVGLADALRAELGKTGTK